MINILLCGINGKMGRQIYKLSKQYNVNVVCGVDKTPCCDFNEKFDCPVYDNFNAVKEGFDLVVDFSHESCLNNLLAFLKNNNIGLVEGTTGFSKSQKKSLIKLSQTRPVFVSENMSLSVNLMANLAQKMADSADFDIEIIEAHHKQKKDMPSGTSLMIKEKILSNFNENKNIPIHSLRGGKVIGEHQVVFMNDNEVIKISHQAISRELFAIGALKVCGFLHTKNKGFYTMDDYLVV